MNEEDINENFEIISEKLESKFAKKRYEMRCVY